MQPTAFLFHLPQSDLLLCDFLRIACLSGSCNPCTPGGLWKLWITLPILYNFPMEPTEIDEFRKQIEEGGQSHLTYVSLAISVLAVLVAMVTVMGHRTHTEAVLSQSRSSDQWNEYQARKMRIQQVSIAGDLLSLQPTNGNEAAVQAKLREYKANLAKWQKEIDVDAEKATEDEQEVRSAERKAVRWDLSEAMLQIAVVLASITLLTRRQVFVLAGIVLGVAGIAIAASTLLVH